MFSNSNSTNVDWYDLYTNADNKNFWINNIRNKKILIVSSSNETIKHQQERLNIFKNCELIYFTPPQTYLPNNQRNENWFEDFEKMKNEIKKIDFDICIISCGAYGYPLASYIKNIGKQSIELCSGIYPIFKIKVKTQQIIRKISKNYSSNDWIFPIEQPPKEYMSIEKGAYWQ